MIVISMASSACPAEEQAARLRRSDSAVAASDGVCTTCCCTVVPANEGPHEVVTLVASAAHQQHVGDREFARVRERKQRRSGAHGLETLERAAMKLQLRGAVVAA